MSRYNSAFIAVASIAAAYGIYIYIISTSGSSSPVTQLHRSNAVRRHARRDRDNTPLEMEVADGLAPTEVSIGAEESHSHSLGALLFYIAEDNAKRQGQQHRGIICEGCKMLPIRNVRYHCLHCPDYDLCSTCETTIPHPITHVFAKIKIPLPVLSQPDKALEPWYPGTLTHCPDLPPALNIKELARSLRVDEQEVAAWWEQFHCLANTQWRDAGGQQCASIDRRAFDLAMTSPRWHGKPPSVYLYDRMFAFYDTASKGVITFDDFSRGMGYLRGGNRFRSLEPALRGYDLDNDGLVDRSDFIRMFRAKYLVDSQFSADLVEAAAEAHTQRSMNKIKSTQPLSAIFQEDDVPAGGTREPHEKSENLHHDLEPLSNTTSTIIDDSQRTDHSRQRSDSRHQSASGENSASTERVNDQDNGTIEGLVEGKSDERRVPTSDLMWQVLEQGFEKMLDPIFEGVEMVEGGQQRMSFEDVVEIASQNEEIRGLVTSWLQYASF